MFNTKHEALLSRMLPSLKEEEKQKIRAYYDFYEKYRPEMEEWFEKKLADHPVFGPLIKGVPKEVRNQQNELSRQLQKDAIFNDNWEPYVRNLVSQGITYAQTGMVYYSWYELVTMIRQFLIPHLMKNHNATPELTIMHGMDRFFDIALSIIGEAYLLERERVILEHQRKQQFLTTELENFVYIVSHDLQEPLNNIAGFAELIGEEYGEKLEEDGAVYLNYIKGSTKRMSELISSLLEYSRVGRDPDYQSVSLDELLSEVLDDMTTRIKNCGAVVTTGPLPTLTIFPLGMKLLFQNLIGNGLKFTKKGVPPEIRISAEKENDNWHFVVEDNGIGISEKDKEKIFGIFQRLHTSSQYDGTGIGLAHVKKIVEMHGGEIWVESNVGKGSSFHFTIKDTSSSQ